MVLWVKKYKNLKRNYLGIIFSPIFLPYQSVSVYIYIYISQEITCLLLWNLLIFQRNPLVSATPVPGLQTCATMPGFKSDLCVHVPIFLSINPAKYRFDRVPSEKCTEMFDSCISFLSSLGIYCLIVLVWARLLYPIQSSCSTYMIPNGVSHHQVLGNKYFPSDY